MRRARCCTSRATTAALEALEQALSFFAPQVRVITFPAWDTVPYDRVGPQLRHRRAPHRRARQARAAASRKHPTIVLTTVNAVLQRVPPRSFMKRTIKPLGAGQRIDMAQLTQRLALHGLHAQRHRHGAGRVRRARRHPRSLSAGSLEPRAPRLLRRHAGEHQGLRRADAAHHQAGAEARPDAGERGRVRRGSREAVPHALRRAVRRRH